MGIAYRFRPGALDQIAILNHLDTDDQLAEWIGISHEELNSVRRGALVGADVALKVAAKNGDPLYLGTYFTAVPPVYKAIA